MKYADLLNVSNPNEVFQRATDLGFYINLSTRKNKKYMIQRPNGKWVHFGDLRYEDYTYHKDDKRRQSFLFRNWRWASAPKYSPAYLSFILLW